MEQEDGLSAFIDKVKESVNGFDHDLSTTASRAKTISLSAKVRTLKTKLDKMGLGLTSDWAKKKKAVDDNRRIMKDALDEIAVEARRPVSEWEEERKAEEEEARLEEEAEALYKQKQIDHEIGLLIDADMDRKKEEAERQAEKERLEAEEKLRLEGEKKAKDEAEAEIKRLEAEKEAALLREKEVERKLKEAEEQKLIDQAQKIIDDAKAEQAIIDAVEAAKQAQIAKQKAEDDRRQAVEDARIADANHRKAYNKIAIEKLMFVSPEISRSMAIKILQAIIDNKIDNVTINY